MTNYDWIVVGSGLSGVSFARTLAEAGAEVLIVERRDHIGGNVFDAPDAHGVLVQRYGAHIFHTGSRRIFNYLSQFTEWYRYEHRVLAAVATPAGEQLVPVPFNFTSLQRLWPDRADAVIRSLLEQFPAGARVPVSDLVTCPDPQVAELGEYVLDTIFRGYTAKQWGRPVETVDPSVLARVPVTLSHDDRYFRDEFQAIPRDGYTAMVQRMLTHPRLSVALESDGASELRRHPSARALWTGRVDAFFDYELGELPYRSLRFFNTSVDTWRALPTAVVNYPGQPPYTRVIDHSHFSPEIQAGTTLTYEFPQSYSRGMNEPFYPVATEDSAALFERYAERAAASGVLFAGRLGDFRYYDMHQAVGRALTLAESALEHRLDPHQLARQSRLAG
ncbi:UDP-galactopyranose mutase [Jatrophihabitans telluris]|uniref:UDP-galactopyranose mutase n=1 Tax=Jatrophihabitans telluris TaxID=2038343 RepID=A0ABY4QWC2_9ACTN|nr:UDP-galactopyranose mutase [Jatrophihabitans telluris]UQX87941.1 UDP-galactopyranose mutase [Jatrophihabitans telluris]